MKKFMRKWFYLLFLSVPFIVNGAVGIGPETSFTHAAKTNTNVEGWNRKVSEGLAPVNVKWYGAKGDGVTDDTTSIRSAYAASISLGKPLYIPSGTYLFSTPLVFTNENANIFGDGPKNTMLVYTGSYATNAVEFRAEYYPFYVKGKDPGLYTGTLPFVVDELDNRLRYGYGGPVYVSDLSISGNANCKNAVGVLGQRWASFTRVDARNATNACWFIVGTVINSFVDCLASGSDTAFTTKPDYGFHFSTVSITNEVIGYSGGTKTNSATLLNSADTFINPMAEVCGKYGIFMEGGTLQMTFIGGTSELNGIGGIYVGGGNLDQYARYNRFLNMDIEANGPRPGEYFTGTDLYLGENAEQNVADGGIYGGGIIVDGKNNTLKAVNAAGITLNGTYNRVIGAFYNINRAGDIIVDNGAANEVLNSQDIGTGYSTNSVVSTRYSKWVNYGTNNPAQVVFDNHFSGGVLTNKTDLGSIEWYASAITNLPLARVTGYLTNFNTGSHTELEFNVLGHNRTSYTNSLTVKEGGIGVTGDVLASGSIGGSKYISPIIVGNTTGTETPEIRLRSGDSAFGYAKIVQGTLDREFEILASGAPYELRVSYIGTDSPKTNIVRVASSGDVSFVGSVTATNFTSSGEVVGNLFRQVAPKITTTNYTIQGTNSWILANCATGAVTLTLPSGSTSSGICFRVKKIDSTTNVLYIAAPANHGIDGMSAITNAAPWMPSYQFISDGNTNWYAF